MKKIYFLLLILTQGIFAQDSWLPLGPKEEDYLGGHYIPIAFNNSNEMFISTQRQSKSDIWKRDIILRQLKDNKWVEILNSTLTIDYPAFNQSTVDFNYKLLVDSKYIFYLASSKGTVYRFQNNKWEKIFSNFSDKNHVIDINIDKNDILYSCFIESSTTKLSVNKFVNENWVYVGSAGISLQKAASPTISFNSENTPYVAYSDEIGNYGLTVQKFNGTEWEIVGNRGFTDYGDTPTIAFDNNSIPYITYLDRNAEQKLLKFFNNQWEKIPAPNHNVYYYDYSHYNTKNKKVTSIYFDKTNNIYLGVTTINNYRRFSRYNGISWEKLYDGNYSQFGDFKMDKNDNVFSVFNKRIKKLKNNSWSNLIIGDTLSINKENSVDNILIEIDKNNTPYISYKDVNFPKTIILEKFNGIDWEQFIKSDIFSNVSTISDFKIKESGEIILLCQDWSKTNGDVYLFRYSNGNLEKMSSIPISNTKNIKMALDIQGNPYVVYVDLKNSEKVAVKKYIDNNWINVGDSGISLWKSEYPSIAIDKNNLIYVTYIDLAYDRKLTVKKFDGNSWKSIDKEGFTLNAVSSPWIRTNNQNEVLVCYGDNSAGGKISVQKWINEKWEYVGLQGFSENYGGYSKMLIDYNDSPYVLCRGTEMPPTIYKFENDSWFKIGGDSGFPETSKTYDFAIGQNGNPVIIYTNSYSLLFSKYYGSGSYQLSDDEFYPTPQQSSLAYPNPVKNILHISGDYSQVQIFDYTGRTIKNADITNHTIDLTELSSGNYILKLSSGNHQETMKIIKE